MNSNVRTIIGVVGLILLASLVGVGLFVFTGFQEGIWFTVAGIPIVVVAGVAVYVRGVVSRGGTSEQQYVRKRGRSVAERFQEALRQRNDLEHTYPRWSPTVDAQAASIADDLGRQGITVDLDSGSFELTGATDGADVQEFERLESEIDAFRADYETEFEQFVETEYQRMQDVRTRLEDADLVRMEAEMSAPSDRTVAEYRDWLDREREETGEMLQTAIDRVREMSRGETRPEDVASIEDTLNEAEDATEALEYRQASESILEARDHLRNQLSGSFDEEREALSTLVEAILDSDVDKYVDSEFVTDVESVGQEIDALDSGLDLADLNRHRSTVRRTAIDIVAAMERDLDDAVEILRAADLPAGYYTEPDIVGETYIDTLGDIDDIDTFTDRWITVTETLVDALGTAKTKSAVVEAYDDVAETIEAELQTNGVVTEDDLPVRHGDQFLGLYYRRNDTVDFDPTTATLRRESVSKYDVTVSLAFEQGGDQRTVTVELDGGRYSATETAETHVATSVHFDDVPDGTYTLSADPGDDGFATVEREIRVSGDRELSISFEERSLKEQVCAETDADMETHLAEVGSRLGARFEEAGYVSTQMDLPVKSTHAPCLVATWADVNGYDATRTGETVLVYDRDEIAQEITNVVRYNLEAGDSLPFAEARERFLSVPVPDPVLRDVISDLETDRTVRTTESSIRVE